MATYKAVLDSRQRKDGTHIVMIRIYKKGLAHVPASIYIKKKDWNSKGQVRASDRLYENYNRVIDRIIFELKGIETKARAEGQDLTAEQIKQLYEKEDLTTLIPFYESLITSSKASKAAGTITNEEKDIKSLLEFIDRDFLIRDFDSAKLQGYYEHLLVKRGAGTVNGRISRLSSVFTKAVDKGIIEHKNNPFNDFKKKKHEPKKVILTIAEIFTLYKADLKKRKAHFRDLYMAMFFAGGMRIGDALTLKWDMIQGDRIRHQTQKNKKNRSIPISPELMEIFNRYKGGEYIFPFIKKGEPQQQILNHTSYMGRVLKDIAKELKINPNINPHSAKHSFAEAAQEVDNDMRAIQGALGHSNISTTEKYMAEIGSHKSDKPINLVITAFRNLSIIEVDKK